MALVPYKESLQREVPCEQSLTFFGHKRITAPDLFVVGHEDRLDPYLFELPLPVRDHDLGADDGYRNSHLRSGAAGDHGFPDPGVGAIQCTAASAECVLEEVNGLPLLGE